MGGGMLVGANIRKIKKKLIKSNLKAIGPGFTYNRLVSAEAQVSDQSYATGEGG
jgi:hypothetical protein